MTSAVPPQFAMAWRAQIPCLKGTHWQQPVCALTGAPVSFYLPDLSGCQIFFDINSGDIPWGFVVEAFSQDFLLYQQTAHVLFSNIRIILL